MDKLFKLPIQISNFFEIYLNLIKPFKPVSELNKSEINLLAILMKLSYKYIDLSIDDRFKLIMSSKNRKLIYKNINISEGTFNNSLSKFKKIGILNEENVLSNKFLIIPDKSNKVIFELNIQ